MSAVACRTYKKAGLSGLFLSCALGVATIFQIAPAGAEPLVLEVARAEAGFDVRTNQPIVKIAFTEASKGAFAKLTADNIARPMEMRIDGQVLTKAVIREPLLGGSFQISGNFSVEKTRDIADHLPPGAKVEVEVVAD